MVNEMKDLFGNIIEELRPLTFEEKYEEYIGSSVWKRMAKAAIERAEGKCQRCGITKWSVKLQVHHLTYERFKREKAEDLEVLCPDCHKPADKERETRVKRKREERHWSSRLDGWATKVYGEGWYVDHEAIEEHFTEWLDDQY